VQSITITITDRAHVAAVMAASFAGGNSDPQAWLQGVFNVACNSYRDQYKTDFIDLITFMSRLSGFGKLELILAAAQQSPDLSAYLDRARFFGGIWAGSAETQAGIASLVALTLLTQAEADALIAYDLPVWVEPEEPEAQ